MKPVNGKILVRSNLDQKKEMVINGVSFKSAPKFESNFREKSPTIAQVVTGNKYLKEGDIIMAHDYWHSQEYVTERGWEKAWGREIEYKHIKETCEKFNLTPILRDDMERSYWACFIKNKI